jgi:divalent metal cation (Fe/Co/Zn/Cd) transporter
MNNERLYKIAFGLALFTIFYNIGEGLLSTYIGYSNESLTLFGFGADSFIEAVSGFGIAHMVLRIRQHEETKRDAFERTALRITGYCFYVLTAGLAVTSAYNLWSGHKPEATLWGFVISLVSIAMMWALAYGKTHAGIQLQSDAILADAACTKVCISMSVVLLISSGIYALTNFAAIDSIGTFGIAYLSLREGHECFEKAKNNGRCSC